MSAITAAVVSAVQMVSGTGFECVAVDSGRIECRWAPLIDVDLFYVALFADASSPAPYALRTTVAPPAQIDDLLPDTNYTLRLRAHPRASGDAGAGWGWSDYGPALTVRTPSGAGIDLVFRRRSHSSIRAAVVGARAVRCGFCPGGWPDERGMTWRRCRWHGAVDGGAACAGDGLEPSTEYLVSACTTDGRCAAPVRVRTAPHPLKGSAFTTMYRVSEYSTEVDFLSNHDAGSAAALVPFLTRWGTWFPEHDGFSGGLSKIPHGCFAALSHKDHAGCRRPGDPAFSAAQCNACVAGGLPEVCTTPSVPATVTTALLQKIFCTRSSDGSGVSWPNFAGSGSPIARYCVERAMVPGGGAAGRGFAQYASCNAPEAGGRNSPDKPLCICWCAFDRIAVSHEPTKAAIRECGRAVAAGQTPACNCTRPGSANGSILIPASSATASYVGASRVMQPYIYYRNASAPMPNSTAVGDNFSCPRHGECGEGIMLGTAGCTWRRLPSVAVITGDDLLAHGWNDNARHDTAADSPSARNVAPFLSAFAAQSKWVRDRCCGC